MTIQIVKHNPFLKESCGLHLWSIHETVRVRQGKVYVKSKRQNDPFVKLGSPIILKAEEFKILSATDQEMNRFKTGKP